jgi:uncharacterized RDD family membrane protein YckC
VVGSLETLARDLFFPFSVRKTRGCGDTVVLVEGSSLSADERFAEWYVWAKREVSSDSRVCLGVAQAALEALEAGNDERTVRTIARRSVAGQAVVLMARVPPRRRAYAEWYDWARRELRCESAGLHTATRAAIECLDRGGSVDEAVAAARAAVEGLNASSPPASVTIESSPSTQATPSSPAQPAAETGPPWAPPAPTPPAPASPEPVPPAPMPPTSMTVGGPPASTSWPLVAAALPAVVPPTVDPQAQAGFWRRLAAFAIDAMLMTVGVALVFVVVSIFYGIALLSSPGPDQSVGVTLAMMVIVLVLLWLYWAGLESSPWQGTIGKRALDLVVTDLYGRRISFGRATGRYFAKLLSNLTLGVGYILAGVGTRKQGLHDMVAGTLVVRRRYLSPAKARPPKAQGQPATAGEVQRA